MAIVTNYFTEWISAQGSNTSAQFSFTWNSANFYKLADLNWVTGALDVSVLYDTSAYPYNEQKVLMELSNGNQIIVRNFSDIYELWVKVGQTTTYFGTFSKSQTFFPQQTGAHGIGDYVVFANYSGNLCMLSFMFADADPYNIGTVYIAHYFDNVSVQNQNTILHAFFEGALPPEYVWTAWDQISGNSGQYRCQLSKLTDAALVDISPHVGQTSAIFERISSRSSIWSIIQNAQLGEEKTIMWSGRNWCTMTMTAGGVGGNYVLTYKFYNPNISETTPFYTYTDYIVYSPSSPDVNTDSDSLLSFAYDGQQQAAIFLPATYRSGGAAEGYAWGVSSQNTPDADQMLYLYLWLQESGAGTPEYPYDTGTEDNGGNPAGPQPGDHMPSPGVPTLSAMSSKMFTVYCPTEEQLEDIAEYLWSDNVITNIRKYFNNFSDNIIALYVLPHQPANLPTKNFTVGNLQSDTITGVKYVTARFVDVDMGSVTVKTTYDSYLDFSPFTRFEIYLPGVGMQTLSADDIMCPTDPDTGTLKPVEESTISVKYTLDLMTGLLVAFVFVNGEMRYQFPGKIGYSIPITGENYTRMVTGAISAMAGLVGAAATGGLTAPLAAGGVAAAVSGTVNAMKPDVHRSGNLSGDVSMMSEESPYLIYHRPNKPLLENQERYTGFPSYKSGALSEFSGLTQVIDAHIEGISCTEAERAEILNLLKSGVIL